MVKFCSPNASRTWLIFICPRTHAKTSESVTFIYAYIRTYIHTHIKDFILGFWCGKSNSSNNFSFSNRIKWDKIPVLLLSGNRSHWNDGTLSNGIFETCIWWMTEIFMRHSVLVMGITNGELLYWLWLFECRTNFCFVWGFTARRGTLCKAR
jgi:hypothetical protein